MRLVAVRETTHARHHAQDVVVQRIHADLRRARARNRVDRDRQLERGLVDAREVARARRLVLLRAQRERVDVDTRARRAGVVLERLDLVEIRALALREAVLAVELELGNLNRVLALAANTRVEDDLGEQVVNTRLELSRARSIVRVNTNLRSTLRRVLSLDGSNLATHTKRTSRSSLTTLLGLGEQRDNQTIRAEVIRVVERLRATDRGNPRGRRAVNERVALDDPLELHDGVVKVQLDLVRRRRDRLSTRVLDLLDEVLVRLLGEAAALLRVEVDIVDIERGSGEGLRGAGDWGTNRRLGVLAVLPCLEVYIDADLVVLEGD